MILAMVVGFFMLTALSQGKQEPVIQRKFWYLCLLITIPGKLNVTGF